MQTDEPVTDEERATLLLLQFKSDLAWLYLRDEYRESTHVVIQGLFDVGEALIRRAVRFEPEALPTVLAHLDHIRRNVIRAASPSGERPTVKLRRN